MSENKRKRGRPLEKPGAKRIGFYVSAADHEWLTALTNRSEWIARKVREDRGENSPESEHRLQGVATRQDDGSTETP